MFAAGLVKSSGIAISLLSASLDPNVPLGARGWEDNSQSGRSGTGIGTDACICFRPLGCGRHCPCYADGWDPTANNGKGAERERLYYSGSAAIFGGPYTNGFAELCVSKIEKGI